MELLLGSDKIDLQSKTQVLKDLSAHQLNYQLFNNLSEKPLNELIEMGDKNLNTRNILMTKYFWWLRLEKLYDMSNIKGDPFQIALGME